MSSHTPTLDFTIPPSFSSHIDSFAHFWTNYFQFSSSVSLERFLSALIQNENSLCQRPVVLVPKPVEAAPAAADASASAYAAVAVSSYSGTALEDSAPAAAATLTADSLTDSLIVPSLLACGFLTGPAGIVSTYSSDIAPAADSALPKYASELYISYSNFVRFGCFFGPFPTCFATARQIIFKSNGDIQDYWAGSGSPSDEPNMKTRPANSTYCIRLSASFPGKFTLVHWDGKAIKKVLFSRDGSGTGAGNQFLKEGGQTRYSTVLQLANKTLPTAEPLLSMAMKKFKKAGDSKSYAANLVGVAEADNQANVASGYASFDVGQAATSAAPVAVSSYSMGTLEDALPPVGSPSLSPSASQTAVYPALIRSYFYSIAVGDSQSFDLFCRCFPMDFLSYADPIYGFTAIHIAALYNRISILKRFIQTIGTKSPMWTKVTKMAINKDTALKLSEYTQVNEFLPVWRPFPAELNELPIGSSAGQLAKMAKFQEVADMLKDFE